VGKSIDFRFHGGREETGQKGDELFFFISEVETREILVAIQFTRKEGLVAQSFMGEAGFLEV
jgi:hypothetical protein